jgi:hypothetical protein
MNFCGGSTVDQQVIQLEIETIPASTIKMSNLCGPCVNDNDGDESERQISSTLSPAFSDDSLVAEPHRTTRRKTALDVIQKTLDTGTSPESKLIEPLMVVGHTTSGPPRPEVLASMATSSRQRSFNRKSPPKKMTTSPIVLSSTSPSSILLNSMSAAAWDPKCNVEKARSKPKLLGPTLEGMSTFERLEKSLEEGFSVNLHGHSVEAEPVFLYLDKGHKRLCIRRYDEDEKKEEEVDFWIEIPANKILRLEIGKTQSSGPFHPMTCFSIVANHEANICYYDFEAPSPIEREMLVSTLMVVLEQMHNPLEMRHRSFSVVEDVGRYGFGGTLDQPIPCSPSLEQQELSPRRRAQVQSGKSQGGTETSVVIHLEDLASPESSVISLSSIGDRNADGELPYHRSISYDFRHDFSLNTLSEEEEFTMALEKQDEVGLEFDKNGIQLQGAWCADDICTLALRDISDTCSAIFALKQVQAYSSCLDPVSDEQIEIVEEYITNALGAPSAVYSYFTAGEDVWTAETAIENAETKSPGVRNRASLLNAQASRLRTLRNEMTFAAALKQSKERMHFIKTTQSYDDIDRIGGNKMKAATEAADRFHTSALLQHVVENMMLHDRKVESDEEEVAYYDSDPEDARQRTMNRGPRRVSADRLNKMSDSSVQNRPRALSGAGLERVGSSKKVSKKLDEDIIVEIVQVSLQLWSASLNHAGR